MPAAEQEEEPRHLHFESDEGGDTDSDASTSGSGSDEERELEERMADIPLEVLLQLKQDGTGLQGDAARQAAAKAKQKTFHRETKNRPSEMSSKRPVSRFREAIQAPKITHIDPRLDDPSGRAAPAATADTARQRYRWLYDDVLPQERAQLKQQLKKEKGEARHAELQRQIARIDSQLRDERSRRRKQQLERSWRADEKAAVAAGKKPYFLKKSEKRKRELLAQYEELKASGRLDKYMAKRRKKNAAKDHRYLPAPAAPGARG